MRSSRLPLPLYVQICDHRREAGGKPSCGAEGARIRELLKARIASEGLSTRVRVMRTGCFDLCGKGPLAVFSDDGEVLSGLRDEDFDDLVGRIRLRLASADGSRA